MMHSTDNYGSSGVPAFLHKLWTLVEDDSTNELISWDSSGQSFHVFDQSRFSKEVLPHYFKHSNIASFIRQLNMYGFRKVSSVEHGGLKIEKDDMEFSHPYFQRGQEHLLENIKRKVASSKSEDVRLKPDDVSKVLRDVHSMKGRQENITSKMDALERENEALWREVASMRQKHLKQQKIVNKLIQFLVTLVGNRGLGGGGGGGGVKRKMPLMINDIGQFTGAGGGPSAPKLARQYSVEGPSSAKNIQVIPKVESPLSVSVESPAQTGGVHIEEMVEPIEPPPRGALPQYTVINTASTAGLAPSPNPQQTYIIIKPNTATNATTAQGNTPQKSVGLAQPVSIMAPAQPPAPPQPPMAPQPPVAASPGLSQGYLPAGYDLQDILPSEVAVEEEVTDPVLGGQSSASPRKRGRAAGNTVALPDNKPSGSVLSDVNTQLSSMDSSLDDLREMLAGNVDLSALRLDTDTLQGLFTPEAPIPQTPETFFNLSEDGKPDFSSADNITGHELIQYNPPEDFGSLFDLGMDSPTGSDTNDIISQESVMEGLSTPQYEVTSPLARRRHSKNATITTDQLD